MKLRPYPSYKDSGVEWLGQIPIEWKPTRIKHVASIAMGQSPSSDDCNQEGVGIPFLQGCAEFGVTYPTPRQYCEVASKVSNVGDLLFSVRAPVGSVNVSDQQYGIGRGLCAIRGRAISHEFLTWSLEYNKTQLNAMATGSTYDAVTINEVCNIEISEPSDEEQQLIIKYLNRETGKLDTLISKQGHLIDLLQEKRQAIISHAVTKGLNPDAKMKDSGVEWLGMVPEHWSVTRLKYVGVAIIGLTYDPSEVADEGIGTLVLRSSNVQNGNIVFDDNVYVTKFISEKLTTKIGDILICSRNGSRALIGKNAMIDAKSAGVTFGAFMTIFRSQLNSYLTWVFNSQLFYYQSSSFLTSTINQLTTGNLYGFEILLPPEEEQMLIIEHLKYKTLKIDNLIAKAKLSIDLAKEHRTALISAAVTGKIDVRDHVKDLEVA